MRDSLSDMLLRRELHDSAGRSRKIRTIYGDRNWIKDLDIVNELDGHSGCVNALSWAKSGRLLASGSDDQHVNIHKYQPEDVTSQFSLATTIATGHRANIFSVKFMPHSNDGTIITAAGDHEVRIFDIEYSGPATEVSAASAFGSTSHGHRRGNEMRQLSDGNTNCRVYRSHGDRVKRIVTESSPHLFLTCSEDGEVRQWDLRQPSSTYPPPSWRSGADSSVSPPLISYKRYDLDLNAISCSPSQPHYIALGGAHLHCFLHDRRMLGRDKLYERAATPTLSAGGMSDLDEELMSQATQCVRKFAPRSQPKMKRSDSGHITACKISDARPNEMIVSWSGDHIYSFDLVRSPDATESSIHVSTPAINNNGHRTRESSERKRKRKTGSQISLSLEGTVRAESRQRVQDAADGNSEMALRVQYQNGQTEDIPIESIPSPVSSLRENLMTDGQRTAYRLAKTVVKLRKSMFTLGNQSPPSEGDPSGYAESFTLVRRYAASLLPKITEVGRSWGYPMNPSIEHVVLHRTLRANRETAWRFVQASGVIARALGGRSDTPSAGGSNTPLFSRIERAPNESVEMNHREQFGYDFLRAIFLWLDSGAGALTEGFTRKSSVDKYAHRLPVSRDAGADAIDSYIVPYLLSHASETSVYNVDASRFEVDDTRIIYTTEQEAVRAFAEAVKVPFADLSAASEPSTDETSAGVVQDRQEALLHWGLRVARGILMNAGESVNFAFVDRAFGGLGTNDTPAAREDARLREQQQDINPNEEEPLVQNMDIINGDRERSMSNEEDARVMSEIRAALEESNDEDVERIAVEDPWSDPAPIVDLGEDEDDDDDDDADANSDDGEEDSADDDEEEGDEDEGVNFPRIMYRSAFARRLNREEVEKDVPCSAYSRRYQGHCNVKTVKDVNFFGLDDEYVVSGSDDGNLFIWDRKTTQLVNILEGDGEVVNVVQGHPYEPMLAVSGIDHTIKVFSPDARAREAARLGRGIEAADASDFSTISWSSRRRFPMGTSEAAIEPNERAEDDEEYVACSGLLSRKRMHLEYQITSQNDVDRQGGNQEAFLTRSMLASLAQHIRRQRGEGEGGNVGEEGEGEGEAGGLGGRIVIGDDCTVM